MKNTSKIDLKTIQKSYFLGSLGVPGGALRPGMQKWPLFSRPCAQKCSFWTPAGTPKSNFFWFFLKNTVLFMDYFRNRIFIDFWSLPDPLGRGKTIKNHCTVIKNQGFAKVGKRSLRSRFWYHFGALFGAFWAQFSHFLVIFRHRKNHWFLISKKTQKTWKHEPVLARNGKRVKLKYVFEACCYYVSSCLCLVPFFVRGGANVLVLTTLCNTCSRLVEGKLSVVRAFAVKRIGFDNFFLQDASGPPVAALASQSSPQSSAGMLQVPPRLLQMRTDASRCFQMPPDASRCFQMHPDASRCF